MSTNLELQKAIRTRLISTDAVIILVPAANILDRHAKPTPNPSIILGEDQALQSSDFARSREQVISTLHIWKKEPSLAGVKAIAGAVRSALHSSKLELPHGFHCGDCYVSSTRFIRDPDGETSHGIVTVESEVETII